jgi:ubiquinone/menaquinone biosynthesis C-methylase UbiE
MTTDDRWSLSESGPDFYEKYQVPSAFEPLARKFVERMGLKPGQRMLDVACGTGIVGRLAASSIGRDGKIVGVDFNSAMIEIAQRHPSSDGPSLEWHVADAAALPFDEQEFDVVLCQQGLQFFPDKLAALREMHRVLVDSGSVGLCVWRSSEYSPINRASTAVLVRHLGQEISAVSLAPFSLGDRETVQSLLEEAGFREIEIEATEIVRHMLPPDESLPAQLASLPFGPQIAALDPQKRKAIVDEIASELSEYFTSDGMSVPQGTHIVLAKK